MTLTIPVGVLLTVIALLTGAVTTIVGLLWRTATLISEIKSQQTTMSAKLTEIESHKSNLFGLGAALRDLERIDNTIAILGTRIAVLEDARTRNSTPRSSRPDFG